MKKIRASIAIASCLAVLITSCDRFSQDSIQGAESVKIVSDKVYVTALTNTSYINLSSLIQTDQPVKLKVSAQPKLGTLVEDKASGLLTYNAPYVSTKGDRFSFVISSAAGTFLKEQNVDILSVAGQADLPCTSIIAFNDNYTNLGTSGTVELDLQANDWVCDALKSDLEITILDGPVYGGVAQITHENRVNYTITSAAVAQKFDKFIYQIRSKSNHAIVSEAVVYINFDNSCFFSPGSAAYNMDIADASSLRFSPLSYAILCGANAQNVPTTITTQATFGNVVIDNQNQFTYTPNNVSKGNYGDMIIYEVCLPTGECKKGGVWFQFTNSSNCVQAANDDADAAYFGATVASVYDVLKNDCGKDKVASMSIVAAPQFGTANVILVDAVPGQPYSGGYRIQYSPNDSMVTDELTYRICFNDGTCSQAKLFLKAYRF